jgi:ethanolamine ammonia-lyase small subunit
MNAPEPPAPSAPAPAPATDPWGHLRRFTSARIALGRAGGSVPTAARLDFQLAHARARDAVLAPFDAAAVAAAFAAAGFATHLLASAAPDRRTYLLRPDLGRRLSAAAAGALPPAPPAPEAAPDLVTLVSDGLAPAAAERHALATFAPLAAALASDGWRLGPVCVVPFARVKIQDEVGARLGARFTLILLGERPGLGAPDSLGAYFTAAPGPGRTDADRNCVSNIRPDGLAPALAARKLAWLLAAARRTGRSGIALKDTESAAAGPAGTLPAA